MSTHAPSSLADLNVERLYLDQRDAVDVAIPLLDGIDAYHRNGTALGSLAPPMVDVNGDGTVSITPPLTGSVPDARYVSPELRAGAPLNKSDDCYSVGVMLYEMLAGHTPVAAEGAPGVPREVAEVRDDLVPQLAAIVMRAIAANPADRYPDAIAFRNDLVAVRPLLPGHVVATVTEVIPVASVPPPPPPRRTNPLLVALAVLMIVGLGILLYFLLRDDTTTIPPVAGQPAATAQQTLSDAGLQSRIVQEQNDGLDTGTAIRTQPGAGSEVDEDSTVVLFVDGVAGAVAVPAVVGRQQAEATGILSQVGLRSTVVPVDSQAPAGSVVAQSPPAGAPAPQGMLVTLSVSAGPGTTTVERTTTVQSTTTVPAPAPPPAPPPAPAGPGRNIHWLRCGLFRQPSGVRFSVCLRQSAL